MMQHITNGMQAQFTVLPSPSPFLPTVSGTTRHYYILFFFLFILFYFILFFQDISAEEIEWDYTPLGYNKIYGRNFTEEVETIQTRHTNVTIGSKYIKSIYREYTDESFSTLVNRSSEWIHMGLLGPAIRAVVGDKVLVTFKNNARFNFSITPTGLLALPEDNIDGASVSPNQTFTYTWYVPTSSGPAQDDPSSIMWFYRSTVDEVRDMHTGLFGPIVVALNKSNKKDKEGENEIEREVIPSDVDREFFISTTVIDESFSAYYQINIATYLPLNTTPQNPTEMNMINGFLYGNLPGLEMREKERIRWYSFVLGGLYDIHTPHWHGQTLISEGKRLDTQTIQAGAVSTLDMLADNPGTWLFHCHVNEHIEQGMSALFIVHNATFIPI